MNKWICFLLFLSGANTAFAQQPNYSETNLTTHPSNDRYASYSPDGSRILFESDRMGSWGIYLMDSDGKNQRAVIVDSADNRRPVWYPDGKSILFESNRNGEIALYRYSFQASSIKPAIEGAIPEGTPQFGRISPDGKQLVFTLQLNDTVMHQCLYHFDRKTIQQLTTGNYRFACANWSPNGKNLVLHARHETGNQTDVIYKFHLKYRRWTRLTQNDSHSFCPVWSNNGKQIAYVKSMENSRPEIFIIKQDGKVNRQITQNADGDTLPAWSPDDCQLLITAYRYGNFEICKIHLN
ncbi:MAG: PD40 domain-containing protein [Lewinellaceae bacterium]|nr:PD40 domain-containing protein [Saprospiraceae bacterium]MCB9330516.1 PD40 domain-containing protein [Lewinellaceae bacterium]